MAKDKKQSENREPGRIKQMMQVYRDTKKYDRNLPWLLLLCFIGPVALSAVVAIFLGDGIFAWILWPVTGLLLGLLLVMIVLGRRAEAVAYSRIDGQQGAVGAVIRGALRRSWRGSDEPIAMRKRGKNEFDAVYRVVGRGGIVLIGEGAKARTQQMMITETRNMTRNKGLAGVTIEQLFVGNEEGSIPLAKLSRSLNKLKPTLRKREIVVVHNMLVSLKRDPIGIPKGIDPNRIRPQRPR
ncbi:MAG: DUF4191 family protein [Leucobacter sp.]